MIIYTGLQTKQKDLRGSRLHQLSEDPNFKADFYRFHQGSPNSPVPYRDHDITKDRAGTLLFLGLKSEKGV